MFSKLFFATLVSTLALSAFSSESAGRYRVEGPSNSNGSSASAGRYRIEFDNAGSGATQGQATFAPIGQSQVAGRYRQGESNFAPSDSYVRESEYARIQTERAPAVDVSNRPVNPTTPRDQK